jgi:hypothetical protein
MYKGQAGCRKSGAVSGFCFQYPENKTRVNKVRI